MPVLRGWIHYFRLAETKSVFEALDGWLRRKLRAINEHKAWQSADNGRGPWWNAGAGHMNQAVRQPPSKNSG